MLIVFSDFSRFKGFYVYLLKLGLWRDFVWLELSPDSSEIVVQFGKSEWN